MPTYQYRCKECGHDLEVVQSFSDAPLTECPVCEGQLRKVFSPVGVVLKGSGFYRTDSRSGGNGKDKKDKRDKKKVDSATGDGSTSSDSKSSSTKSSESTSSSSSSSSSETKSA